MIQVQLKAKHLYLIAHYLFSLPAANFFSLLNDIKQGCQGKADEDFVTLSVSGSTLMEIYKAFSRYPEGLYSAINEEMTALLAPQIADGVQAGDQVWIGVAGEVQTMRADNNNLLIATMGIAKQKLGL